MPIPDNDVVLRLYDGEGRYSTFQITFGHLRDRHVDYDFKVELTNSASDLKYCRTASTAKWQLPRMYFEVMAKAFLRIRGNMGTVFPLSYYEDPSGIPVICTLRLDIAWMYMFVTPCHLDKITVDVFAEDSNTSKFVHVGGFVSCEDAEIFGAALQAAVHTYPENW